MFAPMNRVEFRKSLIGLDGGRDLSQARLATMLGTSPDRISRAALADSMPTDVRLFIRVATAYGIETAKQMAR